MHNKKTISNQAKTFQSQKSLNEGVILIVTAMTILPGIDAVAKSLSSSITAGQITWSRFFFQVLILLPFIIKQRDFSIGNEVWVHAARGILIALATVLFFSAIGKMPLADAIAIFFIEPLLLILLSAVLLKEHIGWRRILASFIGFFGALIIIQPSYSIFGPVSLLPVGAAFAFAFYIILTKKLASQKSAVTMQFFVGIFGCLTMTAALAIGYITKIPFLIPVYPTPAEWGFLLLLGFIATTGHILIVLAIRRLGASMIAPFQYLEIISATILGVVFFNDYPDKMTWIGVTIIVASGLYIFLRERKVNFNIS